MRFIIVLFVLLIEGFSNFLNAQQKAGIPYQRIQRSVLDISRIYNKKTGEKIPESEIHDMINNNPKVYFEREIDRYGEVSKYFYDPDNQGEMIIPGNEITLIKGEPFPLFTYKTINGEILSSENLYGSIVLIRLEVESRTYKLQEEVYDLLENLIRSKSQQCSITPIVLFMYNANPDDLPEGENSSSFSFVENAANFREKYGIKNFPTTLLINEDGILLDIYKMGEEININLLSCN